MRAPARVFEVFLSTLDRKIRAGEIKAVRRGRRVYVRVHGPGYLSDEELLECTIVNLDESERIVRRLRREASDNELVRAAAAPPDSGQQKLVLVKTGKGHAHGPAVRAETQKRRHT